MVRGILTFAFFGADAYVSLTFQEVRDQPTWVAGVALTGATLGWTAAAWIQQRWIHTAGPRRVVATGFAFLAIGIAGMFGALGDLPIPLCIAAWSMAGFGIGMAYSPLSVTVLGLAEPGTRGRRQQQHPARRRPRRRARHRPRRRLRRPRRVPGLGDQHRPRLRLPDHLRRRRRRHLRRPPPAHDAPRLTPATCRRTRGANPQSVVALDRESTRRGDCTRRLRMRSGGQANFSSTTSTRRLPVSMGLRSLRSMATPAPRRAVPPAASQVHVGSAAVMARVS